MRVVPAAMLSLSGFLLFAVHQPVAGYALLAASLVLAALVDRALFRDLILIAAGILVISAVPITTDVSTSHMLVMGSAMILAVGIPYAVSRWVTKEHAIVFPGHDRQQVDAGEKLYLPVVVVLGYAVLPVYMIRTGVYQNWPAVHDPDGIARLFIGTNALGIWDELFFICTALRCCADTCPTGRPTCCRLSCSRRSCGNWDSGPGRRCSFSRSRCCRPAFSR